MTSLAAVIEPSGDPPPDWRDHAACKDQATRDHDPWHPPRGKREAELFAEGRKVCAGCPVRSDCLTVALALMARTGEVHGMWAGMTSAELRRYARSLGRPARKAAQHGTRAKYVKGCRCGPCRQANAAGKRPPKARARWQELVDAGQGWCAADRCPEPDRWIRPGTDWSLVRPQDGTATPSLVHRRCHQSLASRQRQAG